MARNPDTNPPLCNSSEIEMQTYRLAAAVFACALSFGVHAADGDPELGKIKSQTCLGCHGIPGYKNVYPTYSVPQVGGQHPDYILAALKAYKSGERSHPTMQAQAMSLSDQDMADIAAFMSSAPGH